MKSKIRLQLIEGFSLTLTTILLIMSCQQGGFQLQSTSLSQNGVEGPNPLDQMPSDQEQNSPLETWNKAKMEIPGSVDGGTYDGHLAIELNPESQTINVIVPLPPIFFIPSQLPSPQLPDIKLSLRREKGLVFLVATIPLRYLVKGAQLAEFGKLPNGDPVPYMPAGETRGFSIHFAERPNYRLHFYFVATAVGVFVETPEWKFPEEIGQVLPYIGFPIKNESKTRVVGYLALVPNRGNFASGVFVSSRIPIQLARELDKILRY
ncbi:MAG: hypothetical protein NZ480_04970 [Bdellovibrionaceae bacterium]|nr:hypothetical protein [Pseudobdellovibrionaceae bacterium]MDW8191205.1 hypothetical protein [Pseudobdellovibrionaceae bacterium]